MGKKYSKSLEHIEKINRNICVEQLLFPNSIDLLKELRAYGIQYEDIENKDNIIFIHLNGPGQDLCHLHVLSVPWESDWCPLIKLILPPNYYLVSDSEHRFVYYLMNSAREKICVAYVKIGTHYNCAFANFYEENEKHK
jgi:hypothetical protein